jgi:transcriptional regulator with XRE-family HTH domain
MTFGQRLKILRIHKSSRLTQEAVALAIGAPRATYGNWETDRATPDFDYLVKLADYYQVTIDYLLGRKISDEPADDFLDDFNSLPKEHPKNDQNYG